MILAHSKIDLSSGKIEEYDEGEVVVLSYFQFNLTLFIYKMATTSFYQLVASKRIGDFHPEFPCFPSDSMIKLISHHQDYPDGFSARTLMEKVEHYETYEPTDEQYQEIFAIYQLAIKDFLSIPNPENPDQLCGKPMGLLKVPHCHICGGTRGRIHRDALENKPNSDRYYIVQAPSKNYPGEWVSVPMLFCQACGDESSQTVIVRDGTPDSENPQHMLPHECRLLPVSFKTSAVVTLFVYGEASDQAKINQKMSDFVWKPTQEEAAAEDAEFAARKAAIEAYEAEQEAELAAIDAAAAAATTDLMVEDVTEEA